MNKYDFAPGFKRGVITVLNISHEDEGRSGQARTVYNVLCDCGKKTRMDHKTLRGGSNRNKVKKNCGPYCLLMTKNKLAIEARAI